MGEKLMKVLQEIEQLLAKTTRAEKAQVLPSNGWAIGAH
jgi:hypothetical protein